MLSSLSVIVCFAILIVEISCLGINAASIFDMVGDYSNSLVLLVPTSYTIAVLSDTTLQAYWVAIVAIIISSCAFVFYKTYRIIKIDDKNPLSERISGDGLFWICTTFVSLLFVQVVYNIVLMAAGTSIDTSWIDEYTDKELMFLLAEAPVWEEIVTRLLYIGLPMMVIISLKCRKFSPKYLLGGFGMSKTALILIVIAGIIFGLAHMPGWGFGKVLPAMLGGFVFGYLYARFGLYACIAAHFLNNYLSAIIWIGLGEVSLSLLTLLLVGLGIPATVYLCLKLKNAKKDIEGLPWLNTSDRSKIE